MREKRPYSGRDGAEALAVEAIGFLAADAVEMGRFLVQSGIDPARIREAAAAPGFLAGVLEFIAADEARLIAFAAHAGLDPARIGEARATLSGPVPD